MNAQQDRHDLPVLLLHNLDPEWDPADLREARHYVTTAQRALSAVGHAVTSVAVRHADLRKVLRKWNPADYVVLNWCEELPGIPKSDVQVAKILAEEGFTFTGSDEKAISLAWDKIRARQALQRKGVPIPEGRVFERAEAGGWKLFPAIVKPAYQHCSFGISSESVVFNSKQLVERLGYVLKEFEEPALVEDFIDGREFRVTVWGNGRRQVLPVAEMDFSAFGEVSDRLCTYEAKFDPDSRHYKEIGLRLPAPLSRAEQRKIERVAVAAHRAMGSRDYSRSDIRMRGGEFYVLESNPNPDICDDASMACSADAKGYSYGEMLSHLVNLAAVRHSVWQRAEEQASAPAVAAAHGRRQSVSAPASAG
jgi:D-alanine-D-alanine ligase